MLAAQCLDRRVPRQANDRRPSQRLTKSRNAANTWSRLALHHCRRPNQAEKPPPINLRIGPLGGFRVSELRSPRIGARGKGDIWRAIRAGRFPAQGKDDGGFKIDPAELSQVFEPQRPDERVGGRIRCLAVRWDRTQRPLRRLSPPIHGACPGMAGALFARGFIAPYKCEPRSLARKSDRGPNRSSKTVLRPLA